MKNNGDIITTSLVGNEFLTDGAAKV